ncbi:PadR family transcriptional regulator [Cellulomonas sp.]|uniref:PadR family transcriptional regulator n=1 Tax=Cellulomonas sp. TaxID=40001 RepID=UPI003BAC0F09
MDEPRDPQLLKGVLPMLVLALLTERESYGYELVTRLHDGGLDDLSAGTVYPVLNRLERDGQISSRLVASTAGPARKYYLPTGTGAEQLWSTARAWRQLAITVDHLLTRATTKESS